MKKLSTLLAASALLLGAGNASAAYYLWGSWTDGGSLSPVEMHADGDNYYLSMVTFEHYLATDKGAFQILDTDAPVADSPVWTAPVGTTKAPFDFMPVTLDQSTWTEVGLEAPDGARVYPVMCGLWDVVFDPAASTATFYPGGYFKPITPVTGETLYAMGTIDGEWPEREIVLHPCEKIGDLYFLENVNITEQNNGMGGMFTELYFTFNGEASGQFIGNFEVYGAGDMGQDENLSTIPNYAWDNPKYIEATTPLAHGSGMFFVGFTPRAGHYNLTVNPDEGWVVFFYLDGDPYEGEGSGDDTPDISGDTEGDFFLYYSVGLDKFARVAMDQAAEGNVWTAGSVEVARYYATYDPAHQGHEGALFFSNKAFSNFDDEYDAGKIIWCPVPGHDDQVTFGFNGAGNTVINTDVLNGGWFILDAGTYGVKIDLDAMTAWIGDPIEDSLHTLQAAQASEAGRWFTLQGLPVATPERGNVYIRVNAGGKASKVLF